MAEGKLKEVYRLKNPLTERDVVGFFVMDMFYNNHVKNNGVVEKIKIRKKFANFVKNNDFKGLLNTQMIDSLLNDYNYLITTPKQPLVFKILLITYRKFRREVLDLIDEQHIKNLTVRCLTTNKDKIADEIKVDPNSEEYYLTYVGSTEQDIDREFCLTNTGCYICQENFLSQIDFEKHVQYHGNDTDFEFIRNYELRSTSVFKIYFKYCLNSYMLYFTIKTIVPNLLIEKIIIVRSRWTNFVRDEDVPFKVAETGIENFYADSHLFTTGVEQPIVIIYRHQDDNSKRLVEQHHILKPDDPLCNMPLKSTRVMARTELKIKQSTKEYYPSKSVREIFKSGITEESLYQLDDNLRNYVREGKILNADNMTKTLSVLLQMEDLAIINQYKALRQQAQKIRKFGLEYSVTLSNIPPSVLEILNPYDKIKLVVTKEQDKKVDVINGKPHNKKRRRKDFIGSVTKVYGSTICFVGQKFAKPISDDKKYDVSFIPLRTTIINQHFALEKLLTEKHLFSFLFPTVNFNQTPSTIPIQLFNPSIQENPEQLQAVMNIADGPNNAAPFIIFGPPGTGKTTTLVESILQLWKIKPKSRIFVTAGSNAACDEVARRLCHTFQKIDPEGINVLRIVAASVEKRSDNMDPTLIESSNLCHGYHFYPALETIYTYRIIVATLSVAGKLVQAKISEKFFTHIFIDECAASTESEALVAIAGLLSEKAKLILSGDPKQLGPILRSSDAEKLGFNVSLMERLLNRKMYEVDLKNREYDRSIQARLVRNYRTHPDILALSNRLYYDCELIPSAKKEITHWTEGWHMLPAKKFPIIFHSKVGVTLKDRRSTSLCNFQEIAVVMDYVKELMFFGLNGKVIRETDIGIISPYKRQYTLIREELDKRSWYKIETGSVEIFQGKEKPIIIISTVRSQTDNAGFLDNKKRLNVALTRAQALMIIVGNPQTLQMVDDWYYVIKYCKENKCMSGEKLQIDERITPASSLPSIIHALNEVSISKNDSRESLASRTRLELITEKVEIKPKQPKNSKEQNIDHSEEFINKWLTNNAKFREDYSNLNYDDTKSNSSSQSAKHLSSLRLKFENEFNESFQSNSSIPSALDVTVSKQLNSQSICKDRSLKENINESVKRNENIRNPFFINSEHLPTNELSKHSNTPTRSTPIRRTNLSIAEPTKSSISPDTNLFNVDSRHSRTGAYTATVYKTASAANGSTQLKKSVAYTRSTPYVGSTVPKAIPVSTSDVIWQEMRNMGESQRSTVGSKSKKEKGLCIIS